MSSPISSPPPTRGRLDTHQNGAVDVRRDRPVSVEPRPIAPAAPVAPSSLFKAWTWPRDLSFLPQPLWGIVALAPAGAATAVACTGLLPVAVGGMPVGIAIIVGSVLCTLGLAAVVVFLERRYHSMPEAVVAPGELRRLAEERQKHRLEPQHTSTLPGYKAGVDRLQGDLSSGFDDIGLEGRQRFGTQQLTPTAAYARQEAQPIAPGNWQVLSYGAPDGMAYNPIASRGLGDGRQGEGAVVGGCVMDGMLIGVGALQQNTDFGGRVRPGEVFGGALVGAWTASLLGGSEVGYTALDGALGLRLGNTTSIARRDALKLQLGGDLPAFERPISSLSAVDLSRERSGGVGPTLSLSAAKAAWGKGWLRAEAGQQVDSVHTVRVGETHAHNLFAEQSSLWASWRGSVGRAWFNRQAPLARLNQGAERLYSLAEGETIKLTAATRGGGIVAWGGHFLHRFAPPWPRMGAFLSNAVGFAGVGRLHQAGHQLEVHCSGQQGPKQRLTVTWTRSEHTTGRAYLTMPGALGYDHGRRGLDSCARAIEVPHTPAALRAIALLHGAVRDSDGARQDAAWAALVAHAEQEPWQMSTRGCIRSHAVTVPINLLPNEVWNRWLPDGMALETGCWRKSALFEHVRHADHPAADKLNLQPAALEQVPTARGFSISHDEESDYGPRGHRLCRVETQVAADPQGPPRITVASRWQMSRATSDEVNAFILNPLTDLTKKPFSPLWHGAGWRAPRTATLGLSCDAEQLRLALGKLDAYKSNLDSSIVPALQALANEAELTPTWAQTPEGWAAQGAQRPLEQLALALRQFTGKLGVKAAPALQHLLALAADPASDQQAPALVLNGDSAAYSWPAALVRELHLTRHPTPEAKAAHVSRVLGQISSCKALLASDCLVEKEQREVYEEKFELAEQWAKRLQAA